MAARYKIAIAAAALVIVTLISFEAGRRALRSPTSAPAAAKSGPCFDFRLAPSHVGENGCITGYVLRAFTSRAGNTFLDFCPDYRTCPFTSVIFASDRAKFGNLETLQGEKVELRGFISIYGDQAEIIIHDSWQIQVSP